MALNPLHLLTHRVNLSSKHIIVELDNKTKIAFITMMGDYAKAGEDRASVKAMANDVFMWWNPGYTGT